MLQCCTHTNDRRSCRLSSGSFTCSTCQLSRSSHNTFYLRVSWVSTWRAEFLCHMGILSLLPSLPPFFIFLCSYHLPFSCLLLAIIDMSSPLRSPASCVERKSAAHKCLYLVHKFAFPFPLRFIQQIFCQLQRWRWR